ncbi:MAG: hypothetical protein MJZ66_01055 [Bacteroidales bacterium]|nr:hypothetical protein [Bacteroidales bacterium]
MENKPVSPWQRPGGTLAKVVLAGLIVGGGFLIFKNIDFLISLTQKTITLAALCGVLALIGFLITNKKFRNLCSNVYFLIMRKLTGLVVEIDPIAIVEGKVKEMKGKIQKISKLLGDVKGLNMQNEKRLQLKRAEMDENLRKLDLLQKSNRMQEAQVCNNKIVRLKTAIENSSKRLEDSKAWMMILTELKKAAELKVEDTEDAVKARKEEFESIKAQHKAFSSIQGLLSDNPDELDSFTMAMDFMDNDISQKLGEMSLIIDETGGIIDQIALDNAVNSIKAEEFLQKYRENGIDGIFSSSSQDGPKALEDKSVSQLNASLNKAAEKLQNSSRNYF